MMDARASAIGCGVCGCKTGEFEIEGDELVLNYQCRHESAGLIMNLNYIGDEGKLN